jgi:hypothetical protein
MQNEHVCGVTIKPRTESIGASLATYTVSVGDSLGAATTYAPAYNIHQAPGNTVFQDTTVLNIGSFSGGVVQAAYTSTGANVNAAFTDLAVNSSNNLVVTSASYTFTSADVGSDFYISGGTGFSTGLYTVMGVSTGAATLDHSPAATSTTGGSFLIGETDFDICLITTK